MGSRDFRRRESKKPRKTSKSVNTEGVFPTSVVTEVIKKVKKEKDKE